MEGSEEETGQRTEGHVRMLIYLKRGRWWEMRSGHILATVKRVQRELNSISVVLAKAQHLGDVTTACPSPGGALSLRPVSMS